MTDKSKAILAIEKALKISEETKGKENKAKVFCDIYGLVEKNIVPFKNSSKFLTTIDNNFKEVVLTELEVFERAGLASEVICKGLNIASRDPKNCYDKDEKIKKSTRLYHDLIFDSFGMECKIIAILNYFDFLLFNNNIYSDEVSVKYIEEILEIVLKNKFFLDHLKKEETVRKIQKNVEIIKAYNSIKDKIEIY